MALNVTISNRHIGFMATFVAILLVIGISGAYQSGSNPAIFGHSAEELEGVCLSDGTNCPNLGGVHYLDSPVLIADTNGTHGGVTGVGDISSGLELDVSSYLPIESTGAIITLSASFISNDDHNGITRFFAWDKLGTISDFDLGSPYLVMNLEAGKLRKSGGESDNDYAGGSNTFTVPLDNGKFEIKRIESQIQTSYQKEYSLVLIGYTT